MQIKNLQYTFKNVSLLEIALTHRSKNKINNNERLEFLGDSVLSLIISEALFSHFPNAKEGELSRLRAALVKGETIAKIALQLDIGEHALLGEGESKSGGRVRESILAGTFEAIIGAIFCDSNYDAVRECVLKWYGDLITTIDSQTDVKDAKTKLQEYLQAKKISLPTYACKTSGKSHAQLFTVTCRVKGLPNKTEGKSTSRRKAEQAAAKLFLKELSK